MYIHTRYGVTYSEKLTRLKFFFLQSPPNSQVPPAKVRVGIGALTGVIAGLCLGGPVVGIIGAAIGAGIEAWKG